MVWFGGRGRLGWGGGSKAVLYKLEVLAENDNFIFLGGRGGGGGYRLHVCSPLFRCNRCKFVPFNPNIWGLDVLLTV